MVATGVGILAGFCAGIAEILIGEFLQNRYISFLIFKHGLVTRCWSKSVPKIVLTGCSLLMIAQYGSLC